MRAKYLIELIIYALQLVKVLCTTPVNCTQNLGVTQYSLPDFFVSEPNGIADNHYV